METQLNPDPLPVAEERPVIEYVQGRVPPVRLPLAYQLSLGAVAIVMVALPLIYLGFIGLTVWGLYLYATRATDLFFPVVHGGRRIHFALAALYVAPLLAGLILVLFMIKPIFSGFRFRTFALALNNADSPELFRFLGQLCQSLEAPIPSRVDVNLDVNASASFRAGFSSLFGNDIMLTIGLPLVAGLDCREFAGVMAHELGHFRQRMAMRFSYIIGSINQWFVQAVFQRDGLDDWLDEENESVFALIVYFLARVAIGITRGILWLFMICGHALNSFMSRQMEFHADACALAVAGTDAVLSMRQRLRVLDFSSEQAFVKLKHRVQPKLPDDLSTYIAMLASQCAGQTQGKLLRNVAGMKARWYDSHPSDAARTERAIQANLPGIVLDSRPATCLFASFNEFSRAATGTYYQFQFNRPFTEDQLFHVEAPVNSAPDTSQQEAAVKSYFCGLGPVIKPLLLETGTRLGVGAVSSKLEQLRQAVAALQSADLFSMREALKSLDARLLQAIQEQALVAAGIVAAPEHETTAPHLLTQELDAEWRKLGGELEPYERAARDRLLTSLSLLRTPAMAAQMANTQQLHDEVLDLIHVFGKLSAVFSSLLELRKQFAILQALLPHRRRGSSELLDGILGNAVATANGLLGQVQQTLGTTAYPFNAGEGNVSLVDYARAKEYDPDPVLMTCKEIESHLQILFALYFQLLGRLVAIAGQVEEKLSETAGVEVQQKHGP